MWLRIRTGPDAGKTVRIAGERFTVGRGNGCDLVLRDPKVSREHAFFRVESDGRPVLHDLGSMNGTLVNGRRIEEPVLLHGTEEVVFGDTTIAVTAEPPSTAPTLPAPPDLAREATLPAGAAPPAAPPPPPPPPPPDAQRPSVIQRIRLERSVRRANLLALVAVVAALLIAATFAALFLTGVFSGDGEEAAPTPPPPQATDDEPSTAEVIAEITPATVAIIVFRDGEPFSGGSGWVLDAEEGLIVTNEHVVNGGTEFQIGVGTDERDAELVAAAPCEDLAVLEVDDTDDLETMPLGSQSDLEQGDSVVAVGYPVNAALRDELTATTGVVSVVETELRETDPFIQPYPNLIRTDAAINPGNSGGPLVTLGGELVGVNTLGFTMRGGRLLQGENYAIGVDRVKEITDVLREGTSLGWLGVELIYVDSQSPEAPGVQELGLPFGLIALPALEDKFDGPVTLVGAEDDRFGTGLTSYCNAVGDFETGDEAVFGVIRPGGSSAETVRVEFE
jgi:S1-C subfamily serine protease